MDHLYENIIEYEEVDLDECLSPSTSGKQTWLEPAVKLMISLLEEMLPKVGKSAFLKNKKKTLAVDCGQFATEWIRLPAQKKCPARKNV
ncbi:uncharacterized protein isoform X2 [Musca autumnalis]|uniref:uncharacterized protein isoform X2 n=1 Tax=Musca autumnalis TaxID=221902 RepID=UPI003CF2C319